MNVVGILAVLLGLGAVYFTFYVWGFLFVRRTSNLKTLHRYQRLPIWGPLALRKLETIYLKQLEECSSSEDAHRISVATWNISPFISQRASTLESALLTDELRNAIEEARDDEEMLLKLFGPIRSASSCGSLLWDGELFNAFWGALRPFTEKRIHKATTVRELISLQGERKCLGITLCFDEDIDRIKKSLKPLFESKLKKLILQEALVASKSTAVNNTCFRVTCEDKDINTLVATKRTLLCLTAQQYPFWSSDDLLSEINLALMKFLEQQNKC